MTAARTPEEVLAEYETSVRSYAAFDQHRDVCVGRINGAHDLLRALRAAGLLVTPERDREVAARALEEAALESPGHMSAPLVAMWLIGRADRVRRGEG